MEGIESTHIDFDPDDSQSFQIPTAFAFETCPCLCLSITADGRSYERGEFSPRVRFWCESHEARYSHDIIYDGRRRLVGQFIPIASEMALWLTGSGGFSIRRGSE